MLKANKTNTISDYVCRTQLKYITRNLKILGLGTNMGDKIANLQRAIALMEEQGIQMVRSSSVYVTPPWGDTDQDEFLNIVIEVACDDKPRELLEKILQIELDMGRVRLRKWGPRLIDIDMIECDRWVINEERLQLPHPFYPERVFVVAPFAELYPDWIPTGDRRSLSEILASMELEGIKKLPNITL